LKSFSEIAFEPPGYPVYRAFIVPYKRNKEIHNVIEVGVNEVNQWREMLENLRSFLLDAMGSLLEGNKKLKDYEILELIGDLISLFFRVPLNREVLPSVMPSPLKAYAFMRFIDLKGLFEEWERLEFDPLKFTQTFYHMYTRGLLQTSKLARVLNYLETTELSDILESCWLLIPADTRPTLNTASLIPHLLLTSAITWSMAVKEGIKNRKEIALLRLAALLHDVGKPFKYREHVEISTKVAEKLLSGLLPDEDVNAISKLIKEHHYSKAEKDNIIKRADSFASAIDRLKRLLELEQFKSIKDKLEYAARALNYNKLDDEALNDWNFWQRIYEEYDRDLIKNLSEEFVRSIRKITKNFTTMLPESDEGEDSKGIKIVLIDVGGIQSFIYRSHSLKQVAAASLIIDFLTMAYVVAYLQHVLSERHWLPYEAFLYTAGGNVELLVPHVLVKPIEEGLSKLNKYLFRNYGILLRMVDAELYEDYAKTVRKLMAIMSISKMRVVHEIYRMRTPVSLEKGVKRLCQFCFIEKPTEKVLTPEGEVEVCEVCKELNDIGLNIHFKEKYKSQVSICRRTYRPEDVFKIPWDEGGADIKASDRIMEIISGHDLNELQELGRLVEMRNIAVIKVDGVLMGSFMATCSSIADAYERSARIDLALKKSIEEAIKEVYDGVLRELGEVDAVKAALPVKIGVLYVGGDDAVLLAPSWASPLIALVLGKEFSSNLGFMRGLSIGVAVANFKANIWSLIDASSELMRRAKNVARKKVKEGHAESTLCFDIVEAGDLSSNTISERFETLRRKKLTSQPLSIDDFEKMLCRVLNSKTDYSEIARISYLASRNLKILGRSSIKPGLIEKVKEIQEDLKDARRAISETLQAAKSMIAMAKDAALREEYVLPIAYLYAYRQIARVGKRSYEVVNSFIPGELDEPSSLSDVDRLIKIIGGGAI